MTVMSLHSKDQWGGGGGGGLLPPLGIGLPPPRNLVCYSLLGGYH